MTVQKKLTALFTLLIVLLFGCKGEKGDVGPAGVPGPSGVVQNWTSKDGGIKGLLAGTLVEGSAYSYNLDFQGNYNETQNYYTITPSETVISISKVYAKDGDAFESGNVDLNISVSSLADLSNPVLNSVSIRFSKDIENNTYHVVNYYWSKNNLTGSATISDLSYNASTSIISGNFSIDIPANLPFLGKLTISNGTFSSNISRFVARVGVD